jgi:hypothetical protein
MIQARSVFDAARLQGRIADFRCKCEIELATRRKGTLRAAAQFFRCANAANGSKTHCVRCCRECKCPLKKHFSFLARVSVRTGA